MMSQRPEPLRRLWQWIRPEADAVLLDRYLAQADEAAFHTIVQRYAGLVYAVCRRVLPCAADAEDACQATFLVLAQRASRIEKKASLRCWLHGVAIRVAKTAHRRQVRLRRREQCAASAAVIVSPAELLADDDLQGVLRSEVDRLPERYRLPLQLCYWHGQSRDEMAATLGWTPGMVKGQLERARRRLKARLEQRGVHLQLPIGLGLAALGAVTLLPHVVAAATTAATTTSVLTASLRTGSCLARGIAFGCKCVQTGKGLVTLALIATSLGLSPAYFFPTDEYVPQLEDSQPLDDQDLQIDKEQWTVHAP